MKDITDSDSNNEKRVCKDFEIKKLFEYHDLYLKVIHYYRLIFIKNFRKICFRNFSARPRKISFSPRISMARSFEKD